MIISGLNFLYNLLFSLILKFTEMECKAFCDLLDFVHSLMFVVACLLA